MTFSLKRPDRFSHLLDQVGALDWENGWTAGKRPLVADPPLTPQIWLMSGIAPVGRSLVSGLLSSEHDRVFQTG